MNDLCAEHPRTPNDRAARSLPRLRHSGSCCRRSSLLFSKLVLEKNKTRKPSPCRRTSLLNKKEGGRNEGVNWRSGRHAVGKPSAQYAFKNSMIHGILQFTLRIAFRCVLHRCESQDIHCWKLCLGYILNIHVYTLTACRDAMSL